MSEENINSVKRGVESSNNKEKGESGVKNGESVVRRKEKKLLDMKRTITKKEERTT
jgi:hypothetical protein